MADKWPEGYTVKRSRGGYKVHRKRAWSWFDDRPTPEAFVARDHAFILSLVNAYHDRCRDFGVEPRVEIKPAAPERTTR